MKLEPKCNKRGFRQTQSSITNDHTLLNKWDKKHLHVFITNRATESDNKKILMLWLLDDHRRVRGFYKKKEGGFFLPLAPLAPWRQEWLPTWNQKPKVNPSYTKQLHSTKPFTSQCCCKHHISSLPLIYSTYNYIKKRRSEALSHKKATQHYNLYNKDIVVKHKACHAKALPHIHSSNTRQKLQAFNAEGKSIKILYSLTVNIDNMQKILIPSLSKMHLLFFFHHY